MTLPQVSKQSLSRSHTPAACSNIVTVTAVYLLDEITELASLGSETAQGMADYTMKRLGNKSPVVKQKVVNITSPPLPC